MATTTQIVSLQEVLFGSYRLTQQVNQVAESMTIAELDATALGADTKVHEPGLKGYGVSGEGYWAATEDAGLFGYHRSRNVPVTFALTTGVAGTRARSVKAMVASHDIIEGSKGDLASFAYQLGAMGGPVDGTILHNAEATGAVTGTAFNLGAPSSQSVYGVLHVFGGSGDLDVKIQSATDEAFTTPNDRITFATVGTATAASYEWATPIAVGDAWWRITATNPSTRDFAVVVAIQ